MKKVSLKPMEELTNKLRDKRKFLPSSVESKSIAHILMPFAILKNSTKNI